MKWTYLMSMLAVLGVGASVVVVVHDSRTVATEAPAISLPELPYAHFVAGAGIVEATTGNIAVGTPVPGVVREIFVSVGEQVKKGDPLFRIDDRKLQAEMLTATATVSEAEAALQKPKHQLETKEDLRRRDPSAVNLQDLRDLRDEEGVAEASLGLARAQVQRLRKEIEYHTVRAPVAGRILQRKMRLGEYVEASGGAPSLMMLGGSGRMNVRVDIDEYDAWRFRPDASAVAFVRGHPELRIPLRYEYTEPFVVPKTALSGRATERTDTRVLQVLYSFDPSNLPVYIGQQLDVYIEAPPDESIAAETGG